MISSSKKKPHDDLAEDLEALADKGKFIDFDSKGKSKKPGEGPKKEASVGVGYDYDRRR
jgi:hypothetical protein